MAINKKTEEKIRKEIADMVKVSGTGRFAKVKMYKKFALLVTKYSKKSHGTELGDLFKKMYEELNGKGSAKNITETTDKDLKQASKELIEDVRE